jgi:hypothetical protein
MARIAGCNRAAPSRHVAGIFVAGIFGAGGKICVAVALRYAAGQSAIGVALANVNELLLVQLLGVCALTRVHLAAEYRGILSERCGWLKHCAHDECANERTKLHNHSPLHCVASGICLILTRNNGLAMNRKA